MSYRYQSRAIPVLYQTSLDYFSETGAKLLSRMSFIQWCTFLITGENMFCFLFFLSLSLAFILSDEEAHRNKYVTIKGWGCLDCTPGWVTGEDWLCVSTVKCTFKCSVCRRFLTARTCHPGLFLYLSASGFSLPSFLILHSLPLRVCLSFFFSPILVPCRLTNAGSVGWDNFYFIFKI